MTVLLIILAILLLIMLLPVGVSGGYDFGDIELKVVAGPIKIKIFPKKKPKSGSENVEEAKVKKPKKKKADKVKLPMTFDIIKDYIRLGTKALGKFRRKLTIDKLRFYYLATSDDPCAAAISYGIAHAAMANVLAMLHEAFNIKEQDVRLRVDFLEDKPQFSIGVQLTIRIWQILYIGIVALVDFLKIHKKQKSLLKSGDERIDNNGEAPDRRNDGNHDVKDKGNGGCQHDSGNAYNNA